MHKSTCFFLLLALFISTSTQVHSISMEVRRVSDNGLSGLVDFGSMNASTLYAQGQQYIVIRYQVGEEDSDTLKLFSDNLDWQGASSERGGLVMTPNPSYRVPVYWTAFGELQPNLIFTSQNESSWKNLKDQNDAGFASYLPSDVSLPLFPTGTTYVYFGAKSELSTPAAFYSANIKVKNGVVQKSPNAFGNGFGVFSKVYQPGRGELFQIPYSVSSLAHVSLSVVDRKNAIVKNLIDSDLEAGSYSISWNGRDKDENVLSSGLYMLLLEIGNEKFKKKMAIVK